MARVLFWLLAAATLGIYLAMVGWTLPAITIAAGGEPPFDLRPAGYGFEEAHAFLAALGNDGIAFYRDVQHRLDLVFPGLLAATLWFALAALMPVRTVAGRLVLAAVVLPVAAFDWLENAGVSAMLAAGAEGLTPKMVADASRWTVAKSLASTLVLSLLLLLLVRGGWRLLRSRRAGA
jgi:hypothetical protein